jgi:hypothetical protein
VLNNAQHQLGSDERIGLTKMIHQRIVCFRFKPGTPDERIQAHMDAFRQMADEINEILGYQGGRTVQADLKRESEYDSLHYMTFRNIEDIKVYSEHPVHRKFIENHREIWEDVLTVNALIEAIADSRAQESELDEY